MDNATPINKIFCIGYPRTGTTSVIQALNELGFKAWHHNRQDYLAILDVVENKNLERDFFNKFDAFADVPIFYIYKQLDQKYPGSKFILTTRDKISWLDSMKWMLHCAKNDYPEGNEINCFLWKKVYADMIDEHEKDVINYFNHPGCSHLLVRNIGDLNYKDLADFLKVKSIAKQFPHANKRRSHLDENRNYNNVV